MLIPVILEVGEVYAGGLLHKAQPSTTSSIGVARNLDTNVKAHGVEDELKHKVRVDEHMMYKHQPSCTSARVC